MNQCWSFVARAHESKVGVRLAGTDEIAEVWADKCDLLANRIQQHLHAKIIGPTLIVESLSMVDEDMYPCTVPCCLLALQPFSPGGEQHLVLNRNSKIIRRLAHMCTSTLHQQTLAMEFSETLLHTSSYFTHLTTISGQVRAMWTRFLNCGPFQLYCGPVPYRKQKPDRLSIQPHRAQYSNGRTALERWEQRDKALASELCALTSVSEPKRPVPSTLGSTLLTWSPILPVVLFMKRSKCTLHESLSLMLQQDRLFCLGVFFGVPLMDRTETLHSSMKLSVLAKCPTKEDVAGWKRRGLDELCAERAEEIWANAEGKGCDVQVMWSGGIDSTVALISLIEAATKKEGRLGKLLVCYDKTSVDEYPKFFEDHIKGKLKVLDLTGVSVGGSSKRSGVVTVTGEGGDQLFGSMKMSAAFQPAMPEQDSFQLLDQNQFMNYFSAGLTVRWQDTLIPELEQKGLLCGSKEQWEDWIHPQLEKCPFKIVSTFDMLWWLNFSMKWQQVALRMLHACKDEYLDPEAPLDGIMHFFMSRDLELWSCVKENHNTKFQDLGVWKTYKEPLKRIVLRFCGDEEYYRDKEKIGSLYRENELEDSNSMMAVTDCGAVISWGLHSISTCRMHLRYGDSLLRFVHTAPSGSAEVWISEITAGSLPVSESPFEAHPGFIDTDERQTRSWNQITRMTMEVKCQALMPAELVHGRTVLDLGACLGAMSHWAISKGALKAVAVEAQQDFCMRSECLLASAWGAGSTVYEVVCAGMKEYLLTLEDDAFDVVIAAGVLHTVMDPIALLLECARVASHAVCIESLHPESTLLGFLPRNGAPLAELHVKALCNAAGREASFEGLAVVPSLAAIQQVLGSSGFGSVQHVHVLPPKDTSRREEVSVYTTALAFCSEPRRFFLRAVRSSRVKSVCSPLEGMIMHGRNCREKAWTFTGGRSGEKEQGWGLGRGAGLGAGGSGRGAVNKDSEERKGMERELGDLGREWIFDREVAERFTQEAEMNIPDYTNIIQMCIDIIKHAHPPSKDVRIMEVGCANGNTVKALLSAGYSNILSVDSSEDMLWECKKANPKQPVDSFVLSAVFPPQKESLSVVLANWTLHFIKDLREREVYLSEIYRNLEPGGMLILTEKTIQSDVLRSSYHDWKVKKGMTRVQVRSKASSLQGVLVEAPMGWYERVLEHVGFTEVSVLCAKYGFVTWLARRPLITLISEEDKHGHDPVSITRMAFETWRVEEGAQGRGNLSRCKHPFSVQSWAGGVWEGGEEGGTVYGYLSEELGGAVLHGHAMRLEVGAGMYFCCPGVVKIEGGGGVVIVVPKYRGMFSVGGPLESTGRLPYIDGCTDSLLISPPLFGDPCLNHLHFPGGITQTQHTHPSGRAGLVARGEGICLIPLEGNQNNCHQGEKAVYQRVPLVPGAVFCIPPNTLHSFETREPFDHPMVNRTIVNGVSASALPDLRTK